MINNIKQWVFWFRFKFGQMIWTGQMWTATNERI